MRLLALGAGVAQLQMIQEAIAMGHEVVTCDYYPDAPGHALATKAYVVSTFDMDKVLEVAVAEAVDGLMTMGTDQPVYTASFVASAMGLKAYLPLDVALAVTNKQVMKTWFKRHALPHVPGVFYEKGFNDEVLDTCHYPVVVKPVDAQGQRGIYYLENRQAVMDHYEAVVAHSRQKVILVEDYYPSKEVTLSGWVKDGELTLLSLTDRITFAQKEQLGICLGHRYPSDYAQGQEKEIFRICQALVNKFRIDQGPLYVQLLIGEEGIKINEVACRIGGAFEGEFIPRITGVNLVEHMIHLATGQISPDLHIDGHLDHPLFVELFFTRHEVIDHYTDPDILRDLEGVMAMAYQRKAGSWIRSLENATARVGYAIIESDPVQEGYDREQQILQVKKRRERFYDKLQIVGADGVNDVIHYPIALKGDKEWF